MKAVRMLEDKVSNRLQSTCVEEPFVQREENQWRNIKHVLKKTLENIKVLVFDS